MSRLTPLASRYLALLSDSLRNCLYRPAWDDPLSSAELERAALAIGAVTAEFAEERTQIADGGTPSADDSSLQTLLVDPQVEAIAKWLRLNAPPAYTLVNAAALQNVSDCILQVVQDAVPGDLMECGVFRGGVGIYMRGVLEALEVTDRTVWLADSFQGLPQPDRSNLLDSVVHTYLRTVGSFAISSRRVREAFSLYGLLDEQVKLLPGWFDDTLPNFFSPLAVLRCDGDWYSSTLGILVNLYDQVSPGGFVIIDDYTPTFGAFRAVNEFRASRGIESPLNCVEGGVHYWRKP